MISPQSPHVHPNQDFQDSYHLLPLSWKQASHHWVCPENHIHKDTLNVVVETYVFLSSLNLRPFLQVLSESESRLFPI